MTETIKIIEALVKVERLSKQTRSKKLKLILASEYEKLVKRLDDIEKLEKRHEIPKSLPASTHQ